MNELHEPVRLLIMTRLLMPADRAAVTQWVSSQKKPGCIDWHTFPSLMEHTGVTSGNLGSHLKKMHELGWVTIQKRMEKKPITEVIPTHAGAVAYIAYLTWMREHVGHYFS